MSSPNAFEILLGRSLAMCVHPYASWRVSSGGIRAGLVGAYTLAGYIAGLVAFVFWPA